MVEITVRGAGIFGLSVAWTCAARGASVQVIDPFGVASGASGGILGALSPHVPENWNPKKAFQLESLLMAEQFWAEVAQAGGHSPGYLRAGRLQPVADEAALALAHARADTAKALWQGHAAWEIIRATDAEWAPHSRSGWLTRDTLSAHVHPRQACHALAAALATRGVPVLSRGADKGRVVWATGVRGLETLGQGHHRSVGAGVKGQAALLDYNAIGGPQIFADGLHIIPHLDGTVAIGSTTERDYTASDTTDEQLDVLVEKARKIVPALHTAPIIGRWAGLRPRARSRAPILGLWPDRPEHYIVNGGFKIGFGMAPKIGHVMADLLLEDRDTIPQGFRAEDSF